jgi:CRP-like cAMP-binding protein
MANAWIHRLERLAPLLEEDKRSLLQLVSKPVLVEARVDIVGQGRGNTAVHVVLRGAACRYRVLPGGGRQILSYLFSGDNSPASRVIVMANAGDNIATLADTVIAAIPRDRILDLVGSNPRIDRAFSCNTLQNEAILNEWLVNNSRRDARGRVAHLLCEIFLRLQVVGETDGESFRLPLTQTELADSLGLTPVHISRIIKTLREENLIILHHKMVTILDLQGLRRACHFDPDYLLPPARSPLTAAG